MSARIKRIILIVIIFASEAGIGFGEIVSNSLPSEIHTRDGKTYKDVELIKVQPDGLVVKYTASANGGLGLITLKFVNLPLSLQEQFSYNPTNAAQFEEEEKLVSVALSEKFKANEKLKTDAQIQNLRPIFIWHVGEPTVGYSYYDSTGPKPEVFDSDPWAVALTQHDFICEPDFTFHWIHKSTNGPFIFYFDTVTISLGLSNHITLPENPYDNIRAHEEGHRKIYENFYKLGQPVVQQAVESIMNGELTSYGPDFESAKANALSEARTIVQMEYNKRIELIAKQANIRYDEMASHDGRFFNPDDAVKKLTDEYEQKIWVPDVITDSSSPFHHSP